MDFKQLGFLLTNPADVCTIKPMRYEIEKGLRVVYVFFTTQSNVFFSTSYRVMTFFLRLTE